MDFAITLRGEAISLHIKLVSELLISSHPCGYCSPKVTGHLPVSRAARTVAKLVHLDKVTQSLAVVWEAPEPYQACGKKSKN